MQFKLTTRSNAVLAVLKLTVSMCFHQQLLSQLLLEKKGEAHPVEGFVGTKDNPLLLGMIALDISLTWKQVGLKALGVEKVIKRSYSYLKYFLYFFCPAVLVIACSDLSRKPIGPISCRSLIQAD